MKFIAATTSLLLVEACSAQGRLRNKKMYKSSGQRKLQGTQNIFDTNIPAVAEPGVVLIAETPELIAATPTDVPIDTVNLSLSMPTLPEMPIMNIPTTVTAQSTVAAFGGPEMDAPTKPMGFDEVMMSMSMPVSEIPAVMPSSPAIATTGSSSIFDDAPVSPDATLPSFDIDMPMSMPEVPPTMISVQTSGAPETTASEFGVIDVAMSTPVVLPTMPQIFGTTGTATTPAATTSQSAFMPTEPALIDVDLSMSLPEGESGFVWSDEDGSMSMPSFYAPVEER